MNAHGFLGEPAEELGAVLDLTHALGEDLAHLQCHQHGEVVGTVDDHVEDRPQDLATLAGRGGRPLVLDRAGGVQGVHRISAGGVGYRHQHLVGGRVEHLEG